MDNIYTKESLKEKIVAEKDRAVKKGEHTVFLATVKISAGNLDVVKKDLSEMGLMLEEIPCSCKAFDLIIRF